MNRRKKISFKLTPDWMFKEPLDFEFNKYTLLDYLQKCEKNFDNLEIYPDFVELSLHLANTQSLSKENILLITDKKFQSCDDEILLKELIPQKPRELTDNEKLELEKTLKYSSQKLFDSFNIGKSIWNYVYDNLDITPKMNKSNLNSNKGYVFFYNKSEDMIYFWCYEIKNYKKNKINSKTTLKEIYKGPPSDLTLNHVIETYSIWKSSKQYRNYPIIEAKSSQDFPLEQTLIPILKRKITSQFYQFSKIKNVTFLDILK